MSDAMLQHIGAWIRLLFNCMLLGIIVYATILLYCLCPFMNIVLNTKIIINNVMTQFEKSTLNKKIHTCKWFDYIFEFRTRHNHSNVSVKNFVSEYLIAYESNCKFSIWIFKTHLKKIEFAIFFIRCIRTKTRKSVNQFIYILLFMSSCQCIKQKYFLDLIN